MLAFIDRIRRAPALAVRMALDQVKTLTGAMLIRRAELDGHARPEVLRAADRRIAELRGEDPKTPVRLVVEAKAVETEQLEWERAKADGTLAPRIVAATGRGKWTGRL